jgi:class 3 adenylate cyclase
MSNEPTEGRVERRLATILVADVYGYSRMMGEHEERTLHNLRGHRALFDDVLKTHRGRIFNTAGDAILAEFPSAVEAVRAATEIQAALRTRNEHLPEAERLWFRIGINLGDVVVQDGDLLGDGVNVAARIQGAAEPGGICISGSVYDQIQNKLTLNISTLGERSFKNIAQPVRTFAIGDGTGKAPRVVTPSSPMRWIGIGVAVAALAAVAAGVYLWRDHAQREADAAMQARKATEEQQAKLAAELKAAKDALAAADAEKAKREAAEREAAKQAADLKAAKDAKDVAAKAAAAAAAPAKASVAASKSAAKFDGLYQGRVCKSVVQGTRVRCWNSLMTVQNGAVSMSWKSTLLGKPEHAQGTVSGSGDVTLTLEAGDGGSTPGRMTGHIADKVITLTGTWSDGASGNASLAWAPDRGK